MADTSTAGAVAGATESLAQWSPWAGPLTSMWTIASSPERLRQWVEDLGVLAPLAFFLAEAAQVIVSPLPGALLVPIGALVFGPWLALALSLSGCAAGAAVVFAIARRCGRPLVQRLLAPGTYERYGAVLSARGGLFVFLVFAIPCFPADAVCALAGLSSMSLRRFLALSTLGRIPTTLLAVVLAAELSVAPLWVVAVAVLAIAVLLAVVFASRACLEAWLFRVAAGRPTRRSRVLSHALQR